MEPLRMLVISDIHGRESTLREISERLTLAMADLLVICGDITQFGKPAGWAQKFIDAMPVKVFAVPGNCDLPGEILKDIASSRGTSLHGAKAAYKGQVFAGFGGAPPSENGLPFEVPEDEIFSGLDKVMQDGCILVTHAPAKGHLDTAAPGVALGSAAVAKIVEKYRPKVALSGHVHEARGIERDGQTLFVNPGPAKDGCAALVFIRDDGLAEGRLM